MSDNKKNTSSFPPRRGSMGGRGPMGRGMQGGGEKAKDFKKSITRLFKELNYKKILLFALILAVASSIFTIFAPNKLSDLTDEITEGLVPKISEEIMVDIMQDDSISIEDKLETQNLMSNMNEDISSDELYSLLDKLPDSVYDKIKPQMDMETIKSIVIFLVIMYVLSAIFNFSQSFIMSTVSNRFAQNLRSKISIKINKLPLIYFDRHQAGDTLSRVTNDVDTIAQSLNQSLGSLISSVTLFIGTIIMMFYTNWILAITAIVSSLVGFIGMFLILGRSQKYFVARQEELGNINGHIEETFSSLNVVKVYNGKEKVTDRFNELNDKVALNNQKSQFFSGIMMPLMTFIGNFGYVAVCIVGALLASNEIITFGVIVAFITYVRMFTSPLSQIAQAMTNLQSTAAASERVFEFLDEKEMSEENNINKKILKENAEGNIEFDHIVFQYDDNDKPTINGFTANTKKGQKVAIVGPTGAGKTTMVNLLMKFYDIKSGSIKIDGIPISELSRENVHDLFNMVLQDTWLFEGTIKENIVYNQENVSDEQVEKVCKEIGLHHFIKTLPDGYDSKLSDNDSVSAGQRQLLTIARAMIKNAPFLILDEATSNIDTRTEKIVQSAMDKLTEGRTSFIIAHRLSTIKNADLILVVRNGNIVEQGTHEELIEKNGFYEQLYNSQFEDIE